MQATPKSFLAWASLPLTPHSLNPQKARSAAYTSGVVSGRPAGSRRAHHKRASRRAMLGHVGTRIRNAACHRRTLPETERDPAGSLQRRWLHLLSRPFLCLVPRVDFMNSALHSTLPETQRIRSLHVSMLCSVSTSPEMVSLNTPAQQSQASPVNPTASSNLSQPTILFKFPKQAQN